MKKYELTQEAIKTIDWSKSPWGLFLPHLFKYPLKEQYKTKENGGYYQYKPK